MPGTFDPEKHPRGQPGNRGQFGPGTGGVNDTHAVAAELEGRAGGMPAAKAAVARELAGRLREGDQPGDPEDGSEAHAARMADDLNAGDPRDATDVDVAAVNKELDDADSDYRVVPDLDGNFEARPLADVLDDVGADEFEVRYNPVDGRHELGTLEAHNEDENGWAADPGDVADRMNNRAAGRPIFAAEIDRVNDALESAGRDNREDLRIVPAADGRHVTTTTAAEADDDYGPGWQVGHDRAGRLVVIPG